MNPISSLNVKGHPVSQGFMWSDTGKLIMYDPEDLPGVKSLGFDNWAYSGQSSIDEYGISYLYYKLRPGAKLSEVGQDRDEYLKTGADIAYWPMKKGGVLWVYDPGMWGNLSFWRPDIKANIIKVALPLAALLLLYGFTND